MRIFLSYQSRDIGHAERMAEGLRRQRPDIDVFLDARVLSAGAYWVPALADEVAKADAVVLLVGQRIGPWQELEYYEALRLSRAPGRNGRPIIVPVIMERQAPGLSFFDQLHHIFASDPAGPDALAAVLGGLAGATPAGVVPAWKRFNPYKGLPALTSADAAFFFGREELTAGNSRCAASRSREGADADRRFGGRQVVRRAGRRAGRPQEPAMAGRAGCVARRARRQPRMASGDDPARRCAAQGAGARLRALDRRAELRAGSRRRRMGRALSRRRQARRSAPRRAG